MDSKSLSLLLLLSIFMVHVTNVHTASAPKTQAYSGILRDQSPNTMCGHICDNTDSCGTANNGRGFTGTDFQIPLGSYTNNEKNLVGAECHANNWPNCGKINADRTPIYAYKGTSPGNNIKSPDTFYNWFHDTQQTFPVKYDIPMTLLSGGTGNTYHYKNDTFFPLDGRGWNDHCNGHNYAYCFQGTWSFGYQGGEIFSFTGDDDVWVYINNYLVIDLGSLHQQLSESVKLDDLANFGLIQTNKVYNFDFFYCERHTTESHMEITTSIVANCAFTDWCGICQGNGQSCCANNKTALALCDDKNACTVDTCGVQVPPPAGCVHTPVSCPAPDACHLSSCDQNTGKCATTAKNCDDGDPCTDDTCDNVKGCIHSPKNCDDKSVCTTDVCVNGVCQHTNTSCDDQNACTIDTCDPVKNCQHTPIFCDASDKCLPHTCTDKVNGCSTATRNTCDDKDPCTDDSCSAAFGCSNIPHNCDDKNACTMDSCSSTNGKCLNVAIPCDDHDACTLNLCDPINGCSNPVQPCPSKPCQDVTCDSVKGCVYTPRTCDDGLKCTTDTCDVSTDKCSNVPISCDDNNACTNDSCNPATGKCLNPTISCDDNDKCTDDTCDTAHGCQHTVHSCDDHKVCTIDTCDKSTGCKNTPVDCSTAVNNCNCGSSGCSENNLCVPPTLCQTGSCSLVGGKQNCVYTNVSCDDGDACTDDFCKTGDGTCGGTPIDVPTRCPQGNKCQVAFCDKVKGCSLKDKQCPNSDPCVTVSCDMGSGDCIPTPVAAHCISCGGLPCTYTNSCLPLTCNTATLKCELHETTCDDKTACTKNICDGSGAEAKCSNPAITCDTSDPCNPQVCDPVLGCQSVPVTCDDGNPCTIDQCVPSADKKSYTCARKDKECPVTDLCMPGICHPENGTCTYAPLDCDDHNLCTNDTCTAGKCNNNLFQCGSVCDPQHCVAGFCVADPKPNCDDGNQCTTDSVVCTDAGLICSNVPNGSNICDDGDSCTTDMCDDTVLAPGNACTHSNVTCDSNACQTFVMCNKSAVLNENVTSPCVYTERDCNIDNPDLCNPMYCDIRAGGCATRPVVCPNKDIGCYNAFCVNATGNCTLEQRSDWKTATSKNGIICPLVWDQKAKNAAITAGAIAGIAIGGAVAAALIGFGGKKGYDFLMAKNAPMGDVANNPLYVSGGGSGTNPLFSG